MKRQMLEYREFCDEEESVGFDIRVDARSRERLGLRTAQMPYNLDEVGTFVVRASCILGVKATGRYSHMEGDIENV